MVKGNNVGGVNPSCFQNLSEATVFKRVWHWHKNRYTVLKEQKKKSKNRLSCECHQLIFTKHVNTTERWCSFKDSSGTIGFAHVNFNPLSLHNSTQNSVKIDHNIWANI